MNHEELDRAVSAIEQASSVAMACHVNPDGDALGSLLGMFHLCRAAGKSAVASWPDPFVVAPHYTYLPGIELATKPEDFPSAPEVMLTLDCGSLDRLGRLATSARAASELIVVDHHVTNDRFGSINLVDTEAAATAVVVRALARALGWSLNAEAALCLYTGLVTDTGRFQYSNTTPAVFDMASELSGFGLPIAAISRQLFEEHRFVYLQLVADCLAKAELDRELRLVSTSITAEDLQHRGVDIDETEGLIDIVRRASEAEVACVLKEAPDGIRVSLRSLSDVDVGAVAVGFGGGGHRYAAGFTAPGPAVEVLAAIKVALRAL